MGYAKTLTSKIGNLVSRRYIRFSSWLRKGENLAAKGWRPPHQPLASNPSEGGIPFPVDPGGGRPVLLTPIYGLLGNISEMSKGGTTVATPHPKGFFLAFFLGSPCGLAANTPTSQTTGAGKTKPPNESPIKRWAPRRRTVICDAM